MERVSGDREINVLQNSDRQADRRGEAELGNLSWSSGWQSSFHGRDVGSE